jgi:hypothetical protein
MSSSATPTASVNPLTGDLVTISVVRSTNPPAREDVAARMIKPGLAIVSAKPDDQPEGRQLFNLCHVPTGLGVSMRMCGQHVQVAAELAAATPVDWTVPDKNDVVAAIKTTDLLDQLRPISPCRDWCAGDGPEPPSYSVRCHTCDWEWVDEDDEGPLSLKAAERLADGHECEPEVQIKSPVTDRWHATWDIARAEKAAQQEAVAAR